MRKRLQSGVALLTALAFALVFALAIAGTSVYVIGHYTLANQEAANASAVQLADAGINYEIRYISQNQYLSWFTVHGTSNPDTGSITGVGTFKVWVTKNDGSAWTNTSGNNMLITSQGTVNGVGGTITREVQAEGQHGAGLFDNYAVYGVSSVTLNGSGSLIIGSMGTNGTYSDSSEGAAGVDGTIYLNGSSASGATGSNVVVNPDPVTWPTVDQIVTATFPGPPSGWSWISAHNNNANARAFSGSSTTVSPSTTVVSAMSASTTLTKGAIILPPGDYYLTSIDVHGQGQLIVDNGGYSIDATGKSAGLVRIWQNGSGGDKLSNPVTYTVTSSQTSSPASYFRWYDNSAGGLQIDGTTASGGAFYGVNAAGTGNFTVTGNSSNFGSVIANTVTISGNSTIEWPSTGVSNSNDTNWLWFGIIGGWKEVPAATGTATFSDGTSN